MIDSIFEDEIFRIGTYESRECDDTYPDPEKRIFSPSLGSDDREWESILSVVVIGRVSDLMAPELLREEPSNMGRDRRLADGTSDTDDIGTMSQYDESGPEREE